MFRFVFFFFFNPRPITKLIVMLNFNNCDAEKALSVYFSFITLNYCKVTSFATQIFHLKYVMFILGFFLNLFPSFLPFLYFFVTLKHYLIEFHSLLFILYVSDFMSHFPPNICKGKLCCSLNCFAQMLLMFSIKLSCFQCCRLINFSFFCFYFL